MNPFQLTKEKQKYFCLSEQVRNISESPPCSCPTRFQVKKQPKGCYRLGDKVLYIRVSMSVYQLGISNVEQMPKSFCCSYLVF